MLEWGLHYNQVVAPRDSGRPAVVGSGEGIEYVMEAASRAGLALDPIVIAEVMAIETEYLLEIGAVGTPVNGDG